MADIALASVGNDREEFIRTLYQEVELEEEVARSIAEKIENGKKLIIHNIPSEQKRDFMLRFVQNEVKVEEVQNLTLGSSVIIKNFIVNKDKKKDYQPNCGAEIVPDLGKQETLDVLEERSPSAETTCVKYQPIYDINIVSNLGRKETLEVLEEVENIALDLENYNCEIVELTRKIEGEKKKIEEIKNQLSGMSIKLIMLSILLGICIGVVGGMLISVCIIIVAVLIKPIVDKYDLDKNRMSNYRKADEYYSNHLHPLILQLEKIKALKSDLEIGRASCRERV